MSFLEYGCANGTDLLNYYHKSIQEYNSKKTKRKIKYSELCDASFLRLSRANMKKIIDPSLGRIYDLEDYAISFTQFSLMTKKVSYYERFDIYLQILFLFFLKIIRIFVLLKQIMGQ